MSSKKNLAWSGWINERPSRRQRTIMLNECGKKCFLGPGKSFPICKKNTCEISTKGVYSAFVRSREWGRTPKKYKGRSRPRYSVSTYRRVQTKAKNILNRHGFSKVGKRKTMKRRV